ncbi:MAG TPA: AAA family ATPase [Stellaceae bacterium]|nr:AAA family ATPase [Stellaceae bacterium]
MYNHFYGLVRPPFAVTPDPSLLYMSPAHREALATITYGVETRKGFIVCTGEVGTGKTTLLRAFFDQIDPSIIKIVYIYLPELTKLQMTRFLCQELGLPPPRDMFFGIMSLQERLLEYFRNGQTVVLMIDEAQSLRPSTLEFLRQLSNFETDTDKLLQIVLVGQPELDGLLARRDLRQVNQRVALYVRLDSLSQAESLKYIQFRLKAAGARDPDAVLTPEAAHLIAREAAGLPRRMNVLADNVLIAGFGAGEQPVTARLARIALGDYHHRYPNGWKGRAVKLFELIRWLAQPGHAFGVKKDVAETGTSFVSHEFMAPRSRQ